MPRVSSLENLKSSAHIHLMGICGVGMGNFAGLLKSMGYKVTGSDQNIYPPMSTQLEEIGVFIQKGFVKENLKSNPDLVVVGNVIRKIYEEPQEMLKKDLNYISFPEALYQLLLKDCDNIVVTGTHGKTTITSLIVAIMESVFGVGQSGFLVGGVILDKDLPFQVPQNEWFAIEGDEYDTAFFEKTPKFLHYGARHVIITSVEFDHADIYKDLEHIKTGFIQLLESLPPEGTVVACIDSEGVQDVLQRANIKAQVLTYGQSENADYYFLSRGIQGGRQFFRVFHKGEFLISLAPQIFGLYNVYNTIASFVLARHLGWPLDCVAQGIADFKGVKRRGQVIGHLKGEIPVVEDFAHHPSAVSLTLECMKERWPGSRLWVLFEPRSATAKRNVFHKEYLDIFKKGLSDKDLLFIKTPTNVSYIPENERFDLNLLCKQLVKAGKSAQSFNDVAALAHKVKNEVQHKDVVLVMSNGDFENIYKLLCP